MKKIILIEDHVIVRSGLKELIEKLGPYKVSHEYNNGKEFVDDYPNYKQPPDIILLDLDMPMLNGEGTLQWMNEKRLNIPVLVLTLSENEQQILKLFRLGARGYLHKNCNAEVLKLAMQDILSTGYYHSEMLTKAILSPSSLEAIDNRTLLLSKLTHKERAFLQLVCDEEEYTYDQIAVHMKIGRRTVDGYRESIFEKFNLKSKTGLVLFAIRNKLIDEG